MRRPRRSAASRSIFPRSAALISQADTREAALQNIWEAIELYLEPAAEELVQYEGERVEIAL